MVSPAAGLVPVHVGQPEPGSEDEQWLLMRQAERRRAGQAQQSPRVPGGLDWAKHGMEPRWLGMETSDCAVALEPGSYSGQGEAERARFLAGARSRGELALVVAVIGDVDDDTPRGARSNAGGSSVQLSTWLTTVSGSRLPAGGNRPALAPGLGPADRDLAMRLLNSQADAPWWGLRLNSLHAERGDGSGIVHVPPPGDLHPILVDGLGDPVVAAWTPAAGGERWYVLPDGTNWDAVLSWLLGHALPEYVPDALRRARSPHFVDRDLQTPEEAAIRQELAELEADHAAEKVRLEDELREAQARAEPVRYGLLYGTGKDLVNAVATVLEAAGLHAVDLDEELGGPRSADLLVSVRDQPPRRLVEVKAASGAAGENLVGDLQKHLATWPQLRPDKPVTGGAMVVNHQHRLHPSDRPLRV